MAEGIYNTSSVVPSRQIHSFFPCRTRATENLILLCSCFASTRTDIALNTCGHGSDPEKSARPRQHILAAAGPRSCLLSRQSQHGCAPQHRHRLGYPIPCQGTRYLTLPRRSYAPACAPTQHHGCVPRHRHRLCHLVPRHGTCYLTLSRQSQAWSPATTTSSTSSTSSTSRLRATASASALSPGSQPRHPLPHTSSAVTRSGVRSHSTSRLRATASASALSPGSPPRHPLPHTSSAVARSGVRCHPTSSEAAHSSVCCHTPSWRARAPALAATHVLGGLALRRWLPPHLLSGLALWRFLLRHLPNGCHLGAVQT